MSAIEGEIGYMSAGNALPYRWWSWELFIRLLTNSCPHPIDFLPFFTIGHHILTVVLDIAWNKDENFTQFGLDHVLLDANCQFCFWIN